MASQHDYCVGYAIVNTGQSQRSPPHDAVSAETASVEMNRLQGCAQANTGAPTIPDFLDNLISGDDSSRRIE
jgi:hypothetical protein